MRKNIKKKKILLLCAFSARHIGTIEDHISSFSKYSSFDVIIVDSATVLGLNIDPFLFDAIVFHYSIVISMESYIHRRLAARLAEYRGPKILFIQDEYRWVDKTMAAAEHLGISVIFTVANSDVVRRIYHHPYFDKVRFEGTLTGYVPEELARREVPKYSDRKLDVSYRARKLPGWCGSFALRKWQIGERFLRDAQRYALRTDIANSENSRLYGEAWINLVANSRATLGTESGASFVDFSGNVLPAVDAFEAQNPDAPFEEVRDRFLEGRDGDIEIRIISPRCFEAAALRTLMILYPGEYSGILKAGRHYVELLSDHSNMAEVVEILRDPKRAGEIIANAHEEIAKSPQWTFRAFIRRFDRVVEESLSRMPVEYRWAPDRIRHTEVEVQAEIKRVRAAQQKYFQSKGWKSLISSVIEVLPPRIGDPVRHFGRFLKRLLPRQPAWRQD